MRRLEIAKFIGEKIEKESFGEVYVSTYTIDRILKKFLEHIENTIMKGETVELRRFGVFKPVTRKSKKGRNPLIPKVDIIIPENKNMKFQPSRVIKKNLNKK